MDKIKILKELRQDFIDLQYVDKSELDRLSRRFVMLISNMYGHNSKYIQDYNRIHFFPLYAPSPQEVKIETWKLATNQALNLIDIIIEEVNLFQTKDNIKENSTINERILSKVFIVHGHDSGAKNEVARLIEKMGFEAVILHEQANEGATIIEKLDKHTDVGFAVVLYTACDIGNIKSNPEKLNPRARQNVIFEHGLLIGKIGRNNVVALVKNDVEIPNDLSGVIYEKMDTGETWKFKLAKEMKASGYAIDMNILF